MIWRRKFRRRNIDVVRVSPRDVVVYHADTRLSPDELDRLWSQLRRVFDDPEIKVAVIDGGGKLTVMRPDALPASVMRPDALPASTRTEKGDA